LVINTHEKKEKFRKLSDLKHRALINGIGFLVVFAFIIFAEFPYFKWFFTAAVALLCSVALWEFYELAKKKHLTPPKSLGIILSIIYLFAVFIALQNFDFRGTTHLPWLMLIIMFLSSFIPYAIKAKDSMMNIAILIFGYVYITIPLSLVLGIVYFFVFAFGQDRLFEGSWWLAYCVAVTKCGDMGGYFIGRKFGKHKLAISLSPNKTFEGAIGGLISSISASVLLCFIGKQYGVFLTFSYLSAFFLGLSVGILGQMGDLAESLLKRDAKVKDSNRIPGVGGILDEIDSLIFTIPVIYLFLMFYYT
jgi:phosphatidate cytidylyltransferase